MSIERKEVEQMLREEYGLVRFDRIASSPVLTGEGTPEGVVTATPGVLFLRTDGGAATTLYVKESGASNTGWVAK